VRGESPRAVWDGTIDEDADVFATIAHEQGWMSTEEWALYQRIYTQLLHTPGGAPPTVVLWIDLPVEEAIARIYSRGRPSEQQVEPTYWTSLHAQYQRWIHSCRRSPVIRLTLADIDVFGADRTLKLEAIASRVRAAVHDGKQHRDSPREFSAFSSLQAGTPPPVTELG